MTAFIAIIGILTFAGGIQFFQDRQKKQASFKHYKHNNNEFFSKFNN